MQHPLLITRRDLDAIEATRQEARDYVAKREKENALLPAGAGKEIAYGGAMAFGAFGAGVAYGRYGDLLQRSPVPVDLALGVAGHALAFKYADRLGESAEYLHALSWGLVASFATKAGIGVGTRMRAQHDPALPPVQIAGASPHLFTIGGVRPSPLNEAEHAARAHRWRRRVAA